MKQTGLTIVRGENLKLPDDFLAKGLAENKTSISYAAIGGKEGQIVVRKNIGQFTLEQAKEMLEHPHLISKKLFIHLGNDPSVLNADDVQPFTILSNDKGKPVLVAWLNGDFSNYKQEGQTESGEARCVKLDVIPLVTKAFKLGDNDLHKTIAELGDTTWAHIFANMMVGPEGSITLLAATGDTCSFLVEGETSSGEVNGCWVSNTYAEGQQAGPVDDLADEFGEAPAAAPTAKPLAPAIPETPAQAPEKPGHGLPGHDVHKAKAPALPQPGPGAATSGAPASVREPMTPETWLTIRVPPGIRPDKKAKWFRHRTPEGWSGKIAGATTLSLQYKDCNKEFMNEYLVQNGIKSLADVVKPSAAIPASAGVPKVTEKGFPARASEPETKPAEPAQKPPAIPEVPAGDPAVTDIPQPVFSPAAVIKLLNFMKDPAIKAAYDKYGEVIAHPGGLEKMEAKLPSLEKQFGGKITIMQIAATPYENTLKFVKSDKEGLTVATLIHYLSLELLKASNMLDALTDPHTKKAAPQAEAKAEPQAVETGGARRRIPMIAN